ncbi:hypothetical protein LMG23992_00646 [Cupriavidus laharis]|uniref:Small-conductance mechanosensitive channel n=1 Tax=Cupriavidus laharis TaxID=151654 RepID=A0ABM8WF46_9BURK|nr:mechanosensitive ion channel domain-containing protein [Cupriavidus laharis]CAG9165934.1 hypothetical protein LMG23992_00646 [Cupriavidus laharis]
MESHDLARHPFVISTTLPALVRHCMAMLMLALALALPFAALAADKPAPAQGLEFADLTLMNRPVATFRATLAGASPAVRAERAKERFNNLDRAKLAQPLTRVAGRLGNASGVAIRIGDLVLFAITEGDLDPEQPGQTTETEAAAAAERLEAVIAARRDQLRWPTIIRGTMLSMLGLLVFGGLVWGIARARRRLSALLVKTLEHRVGERARRTGFDWTSALFQVASLVVQIVGAGLIVLLVFLWLEFALDQFPLTAPLGQRMGTFLLGLLARIGEGMLQAVPGVVTVIVILLITRAVQRLVASIFDAVERGQISMPGLHPETAGATRRLASVVLWALGLTFAYPYIPGSQSDVFKGLSVLFGFMVTLGSANIVNQIMSGMVLVYSRALRPGDMVDIGGTVGTVTGLDTLSVKIENLRQEEVTLPNAVVVGSAVHNFSRRGRASAALHGDSGALLSTAVTIGYDTPWRQVHAMLLSAVASVPGLRGEPVPFVLQRGLSDFYVEYELFFGIADPRRRFFALSTLHQAIQDEFNRQGVQIMSPHFVLQPDEPVVVPPAKWHQMPDAAGARRELRPDDGTA